MQKKMLLIMLLTFILCPRLVLASGTIKFTNGKESIKSAVCNYKVTNNSYFKNMPLPSSYVKINFANEKLVGAESEQTYTYLGSDVTYNTFFSGEKFECPNKLSFRKELNSVQGHYVHQPKNDDDMDGNDFHLVFDKNGSTVTYNYTQGKDDTPKVTVKSECALTRTISDGQATKYQKLSPSELTYTTYSDNTTAFVGGDGTKYKISSGSISDCSTSNLISLHMNIKDNKISDYTISNCNPNTEQYCVGYRLSKYVNANPNMNDDGTVNNSGGSTTPTESTDSTIDFDITDENNCESYLGKITDKNAPAYYLHIVFNVMKYIAILLLGGLTVADIFKAITSQKDEGVKKIVPLLVKRLIIVVIIFFIPDLVEFMFELFGIITSTNCV